MQKLLTSMAIETCFAGTVVYPPGGTYGPRQYREFQLFLLHSGTVRVELDGNPLRMVTGQILLLTPGHEVYIAFDKTESTWHRWITVIPDGLEPELQSELDRLPRLLPISEQMNQLVDLAVRQQREDLPEHEEVLKSLGRAAIQLYAVESVRSAASGSNPIVRLAKSLISEKYAENLSMREIAEGINVSQSHLVRLFRQHEKMAPIEYLWRYRVERGIDLLRTTGLSIGEVSERCGFKSSYHFARLVKNQTRQTPTEIRTSYWRADEGNMRKSGTT